MLNVKPEPPVADAVIIPFDCPAVAFVIVPVTVTVTPAHGFGGGGGGVVPPPPLLQE